jgi:hypothetical protein
MLIFYGNLLWQGVLNRERSAELTPRMHKIIQRVTEMNNKRQVRLLSGVQGY